MGVTSDLMDTVRRLSALESRTEDVKSSLERVHDKLDTFIDRLSRIESNYEHLRTGVKAEIMGDIQGELSAMQVRLEYEEKLRIKFDTRKNGQLSDASRQQE